MSLLRFEHIEYFIEAYKTKSITKAASNLFISQQSLSHTIKQLEEQLGQQLFHRTVKGVQPTDAGKRLYMSFHQIVDSYQNAVQQYTSKNINNSISVAATSRIVRIIPLELLLSFCESRPQIKLDFTEISARYMKQFIGEDKNRLGLITAPEYLLERNFNYIALFSEPVNLLVHIDNPISKMPFVSVSALRNENYLGVAGTFFYIEALNEAVAPYGYTVTPYFESEDIVNLYNMVDRGNGVMLCSERLYKNAMLHNSVLVPIQEKRIDYCTAVVFQDYSALTEWAKDYIRFIQQIVIESAD